MRYVAYLDETGHSAGTAHVGIAGLVAKGEAWKRFRRGWRESLKDVGVGYFHSREFFHSIGQFQAWKGDENRRRGFLQRLINLVQDTDATIVGAIVSVPDFRAMTPKQQGALVDPYFVCFQTAARGAAIVGVGLPDEKSHDIEMIFARQTEFEGKAGLLWDAMKRSIDQRHRMKSYRMLDMKKDPGLQAADLVAYELFKDSENRASRPTDNVRWALQQILQNHHCLFEILDRLELVNRFLPDNIRRPIQRPLADWVKLTPGARLLAKPTDQGWHAPSLAGGDFEKLRDDAQVQAAVAMLSKLELFARKK
jgi:hypothetical protein